MLIVLVGGEEKFAITSKRRGHSLSAYNNQEKSKFKLPKRHLRSANPVERTKMNPDQRLISNVSWKRSV